MVKGILVYYGVVLTYLVLLTHFTEVKNVEVYELRHPVFFHKRRMYCGHDMGE